MRKAVKIASVFFAAGLAFAGCGEGPAGLRGEDAPPPVPAVGLEVEAELDLRVGLSATVAAVAVARDPETKPTVGTLLWELYDAASGEVVSLGGPGGDSLQSRGPILAGDSVVVTGLARGEARILVTAIGSAGAEVTGTVTVTVTGLVDQIADLHRIADEDGLPPEFTLYAGVEWFEPYRLYFDGGETTVTLRGAAPSAGVFLPPPQGALVTVGSMFTVGRGVTLVLEDITLHGTAPNNGNALVRVESGGTLIMNSGASVTGNTNGSVAFGGGGVRVDSGGRFEMNDGEIHGNTANQGGGIWVNGGRFDMRGGEIRENAASAGAGGGVRVTAGGVFEMHSGTISENSATTQGGGVQVLSSAAAPTGFSMRGGTISRNMADDGGGVFTVGANNFFEMYAGTITENSAGWGGGVHIMGQNAAFNMRGGTISRNMAGEGGGVYITDGRFTMHAGTILGNGANWGGGVLIDEPFFAAGNFFLMIGGEISGNTATTQGGGVWNGGTMQVSDGIIHGTDAAAGLGNTAAGTGAGAAIRNHANATVRHGTFAGTGTGFASLGDIVAGGGYVDLTVEVAGGVLVRP